MAKSSLKKYENGLRQRITVSLRKCLLLGAAFALGYYSSTFIDGPALQNNGSIHVVDNKDLQNTIKVNRKVSRLKAEYRPEDPLKSWRYDNGSSNGELLLPDKLELHFMSLKDSGALYHRYLNSIQVLCRQVERMGSLSDGGWDICVDKRYAPRNRTCLVYSFGIGNDFSFDEAVFDRYGCEVHSFDPSIGRGEYKHKDVIFFHPIGIGKVTGRAIKHQYGKVMRWPMKRFKDVVKTYGHTDVSHIQALSAAMMVITITMSAIGIRAIDIVKMDIEHSEWEVLPDMCDNGDLSRIRQIVVELHSFDNYHAESGDLYTSRLKVLKCLYDAGFRIFLTHRNLRSQRKSSLTNLVRVGLMEVSFINIHSPDKGWL